MCDTFVYVPKKENDSNIVFAKNSDREPNEAQAIIRIPAQKHKSVKLQCTYIEIPQVQETYEVILSKPFQMWGLKWVQMSTIWLLGTRLFYKNKN